MISWYTYSTEKLSVFQLVMKCRTEDSYHWRVPVFVVTFASYEVSASVAEDFILLGFDASSVGNRIPTFRGNVVTSSSCIDFCFSISTLEDETVNLAIKSRRFKASLRSRLQGSKWKNKSIREEEVTTLPRNVGIRLPTEEASNPRRMKSSATLAETS